MSDEQNSAEDEWIGIADVISGTTDGWVINYVTVASFIDSDGNKRWYYETDESMEPWEVLGLLEYAKMVETAPPALIDLMKDEGDDA